VRPRLGLGEIVGVLAAIAVLSTLTALPKSSEKIVGLGGVPAPAATNGVTGGPAVNPTGVPTAVQGTGPQAGAPGGLACAAGRNGGATDVGVSATSIKFGATVVETGIGAAFLSEVRFGMQAVVNKVNAAGGVCGRNLQLVLKDDGWRADTGNLFIQNLVKQEKVFALAVVPSSEGLRVASTNKFLRREGVPVVGTDGMLVHQYTDPVIWPVAASTITAMHVIAKHAYDQGARDFGIVYDANYHFGIEGAFAFNAEVKRLTGKDIRGYSNPLTGSRQCNGAFCGVQAGQSSYNTEVNRFNEACGPAANPECHFAMFLLEPETALRWIAQGGAETLRTVKEGYSGPRFGGPQPLFNRGFGSNCGQACDGMWVWTGFVPPIDEFERLPALAAYREDLRRTNSTADPTNSFVQGGYLGMTLLVEALKAVGPNLTRRSLMATLDALRLDTGLSRPLAWAPGKHFANECLIGFSIQSAGGFSGFARRSEFICDHSSGRDIPPDNQQ
jgi:ABC-type branched-subunit amino acid transport system substrate-binding protein